MACPTVQFVFVAKRTGNKVPFYPHHDVWLREAMDGERPFCPIEHMDSEDTLFLLYTSGSTGKPKGVAHTTAGYLLQAALTHRLVFDYRPGDVFACVADVGWITGHSYVVYGPLCNGATTVLFESIPTYPDAGRYWEMVQRLGITQFYTAPTAIRAIAREGDAFVQPLRPLLPAGSWAASASPSTPRPGAGTTTWSARAGARWWTPGGRPRPAAS